MDHVFYTKIVHIRVSENEGSLFWMKIVKVVGKGGILF